MPIPPRQPVPCSPPETRHPWPITLMHHHRYHPLPIIPKPVSCGFQDGHFQLRDVLHACVIANEENADAIHAELSLAAEALSTRFEIGLRILAPSQRPRADLVVRVGEALSSDGVPRGDETYRLQIGIDRIDIAASGVPGIAYAMATLRQLIAAFQNVGRVPCCVIDDEPRFAWRGFMLDSARHFQEVDWIKRHLDRMADLKLNRFHWHLTDDQGWRAEIRRYPRLTEVAAWRSENGRQAGGFYTQDQMREVVAYARERHIVVIPEVDMPAHCNAALIACPGLSCSGEPLPVANDGWDAYTRLAGRRAFCAGKPATYEFLEGVLSELADVFNAPHLHLGGDETPFDCWDDCIHCQALRKSEDLECSRGLRSHLLQRVHAFCRDQLGRGSISWTDGVDPSLPADMIVQAWKAHEVTAAAALGHRVINSNHEWCYLDYPATAAGLSDRPDWMIPLSLEKAYHFNPIPDGLAPGLHHLVLGGEAPIWTEYCSTLADLETQITPRLTALAEVFWSPAWGRSFDEFSPRLRIHQRLGTFATMSDDADQPAFSAAY